MTTARQVAADVLHHARVRQQFATEIVEERAHGLSPQDRRLAVQLVMGVVRRRATLDALVKPFIRIPFHAVQPRVWDAIHLGAYQLALLTQIPRHAAVHETVELAGHVGSPQAKGFINGILRRVSELVTDESIDQPASNALPLDDRYRRLTQAIFPDPRGNEAAYLAAAFSWPQWLAVRWFEQQGWDECLRLGFWFNKPPLLTLRVNRLHVDRETYRLRLAAQAIAVEAGVHPQSLILRDHVPVRDLPGYTTGDFVIQDVSAMAVASALNPAPGMRVLDLCSAPGGKTTHLAEWMQNRGTIIACDVEQSRLDIVTTLCHRLGITIVEPRLLGEQEDPPAGPFDAALVDVPCSNTGVLGKRPEVRWRLQPREFPHLIRLQTRLLIQAVERVRPGGIIVYSTCSIDPDENQGVVKVVQRALKGLVLETEHHAIPGLPGDGGYWARLRKVADRDTKSN